MQIKNFSIIVVLGALLFIPFLGHVHLFDWDEINFAESAREMLVSHKFSQVQINFEPFYEKPPFFMWMQAVSMSVFGINEFGARFPNAIVGIITLLVIFNIGSKLLDDRFGWLWVFCYIGSFLPHFYFKTGLIDPLFNLFIFSGIYQFVKLTNLENYTPARGMRIAILAGIFIGLGILTKGPVALLVTIVSMAMYWASFRFKPVLPLKHVFVFLITAFVVSSAWFGLNMIKNGPVFIFEFINRQIALFKNPDAGHDGPFYYHFIVLLFGCFPASLFMISALRHDVSETYGTRNMKNWMIILLITVLFIFSIVRTKIIHYSSLSYFPITFLAAYGLYKMIYLSKNKIHPLLSGTLFLVAGAVAAVLISVPYLARHQDILIPYLNDDFGKAALHAKVNWSGWEMSIGIIYIIFITLSLYLFTRKEVRFLGAAGILISGAFCVQMTLLVFAPKIEAYSQKAAIDFFIDHQNEDCYADVWGYRSYAPYFYGRRNPGPDMGKPYDTNIFYSSKIAKPAYMVFKINDPSIQDFVKNHHFKILEEKNGFVFLKREKDN